MRLQNRSLDDLHVMKLKSFACLKNVPEEDLDLINDRLITVLNHSLNADGL